MYLYSVDVSPVDATGHTMQPGEQFGSVHSTLCQAGGGSTMEEEVRGGFWFGGDADEDSLDPTLSGM